MAADYARLRCADGSPGLELEAGGGQAAADQVGRRRYDSLIAPLRAGPARP